MHDSLKREILKLARYEYPNWVHGGRFEKLAFELNFKPSNASRRARELEKASIFEKRYNEKRQVEYRLVVLLPQSHEQEEQELLMQATQ